MSNYQNLPFIPVVAPVKEGELHKEMLKTVMNLIIQLPHHWDQSAWHCKEIGCGTTHCFAGWVEVIDKGKSLDWTNEENEEDTMEYAMRTLGISHQIASQMFFYSPYQEDLYSIVTALLEGSLNHKEADAQKIFSLIANRVMPPVALIK